MKPSLKVLSAAILLTVSSASFAWEKDIPHEDNDAYVQDTDNNIVRDRWGGCVRTRDWSEALAIQACDPGLKKFQKAAKAPAEKMAVIHPPAAPIAKKPVEKVKEAAPKAISATAISVPLSFSGFFKSGGSELTGEAKTKLDAYVEYLKANPKSSVAVKGYTDSRGSVKNNQRLSEKRANSVKLYLEGEGVDASRIKATGLGEANPISDNATAEGRAQNRRVELVMSK